MYQLLFCLTSSQKKETNNKQKHRESACGMVCVCVRACAHMRACVCACVCVQPHTHTHIHTCTHAHKPTPTPTHTHTHTQDPSPTVPHLLKAILVCSQKVEGVLQEGEAQPVQHQSVQVHRQAVQAVPGGGARRCSCYLQHRKYKQDHDRHVCRVVVTGQ